MLLHSCRWGIYTLLVCLSSVYCNVALIDAKDLQSIDLRSMDLWTTNVVDYRRWCWLGAPQAVCQVCDCPKGLLGEALCNLLCILSLALKLSM